MRNFIYLFLFLTFSLQILFYIMSNDNRGSNTGGGDLIMKDVIFTLKTLQQQFEGCGREMMNMRGDLEEVRQLQHTDGNQTGVITK